MNRKFFSLAGVLFLCCFAAALPSYAQTVAYYRFENGTANTAATAAGSILDSSGNGFNGTPVNSPIYRPVPETGTTLGLQFAGTGQKVFVPDNTAFALTQSLTLEALIRFDGIASGTINQANILFRGDDRQALDPYVLYVGLDGKLNFSISNASGVITDISTVSAIPTGQYMNVAASLNNSTNLMSLYINGIVVASTSTTNRPFGTLDQAQNPGFSIGDLQSGTFYPEGFNGIIDEVRVSNVALTSGQLLSNSATPEPSAFLLIGAVLPCFGYRFVRRCKK